MPIYYPGTNTLVTRSFSDRLLVAEFDDALIDQSPWKNPRYEGCRINAQRINHYTGSDDEHGGGSSPLIKNETTALYIANTVVGGTEDNQFATIKDHSYIGISKIVIVDNQTNTTTVLDKQIEDFDVFHRYVTNDFPTGGSFHLKVLDESTQTNLKNEYKVKMNKGYLLKTFDFRFVSSSTHLPDNNSMYFYKGGREAQTYMTGSQIGSPTYVSQSSLRFRYAVNELYAGNLLDATPALRTGSKFDIRKTGPSFESSSIIENKYTQQYYTGSYGFINDSGSGVTNAARYKSAGIGSASKFLGVETLNFLKSNNSDPSLSNKDKTELHITFFEGTKDFSAPGGSGSLNDERSISTFELDNNQSALDLGDECNAFLPTTHELILKGINQAANGTYYPDNRFLPRTNAVEDDIQIAYMASTASAGGGGTGNGCPNPDTDMTDINTLQKGIDIKRVEDAEVFVQGGSLGAKGLNGAFTSSDTANYGDAIANWNGDNDYSGSFRYEVSFLDKDHTLIADLDKDAELFDGIGSQGLVLIPQYATNKIKNNVEFYLKAAGIIPPTQGPSIPNNFNLEA